MRPVAAFVLAGGVTLSGCSGCSKAEGGPSTGAASASASTTAPLASATVVAETLPRCRAGARVAVPGDDVVVGEAVISPDALIVGVVRREGSRRLASVVRASLDLTSVKVIDVGPALGDDPPPTPRLRGSTPFVTSFARRAGADAGADAGAPAGTRLLAVARLAESGLVAEGTIAQQADESLAYDVAWPEGSGAGIVAWDEDALPAPTQLLADRGIVKVQLLGGGTKARVASPERSDAEAPRLLARPGGGYWLAWLARRAEATEDAGPNGNPEGPGERRAYRWVELVALDGSGEPTSPVRRISPEKGRAASFDLVRSDAPGDGQLVVLVQDEAAHAEGAGERLVRYVVDGDKLEGADLLDGGVGHALADLLPRAGASRWLSFMDTQDHAHLVPLGAALRATGPNTLEPALDGARVLGASPPDSLFAVGPAFAPDSMNRLELRRLVCH